METTKIPVTVYVEMTPNPASMKFVADRILVPMGKTVEFQNMGEAKGYSPFAEALFTFPFITNVFLSSNFVTLTKTESMEWEMVNMQLREFITDFISSGKELFTKMPEETEENAIGTSTVSAAPKGAPSEYDEEIKKVLEEYVRPAVERDGGAIDYHGYKDGVVSLILRGSCSGCPSSMQTLKGGIEGLLKRLVPSVTSVEAFEG